MSYAKSQTTLDEKSEAMENNLVGKAMLYEDQSNDHDRKNLQTKATRMQSGKVPHHRKFSGQANFDLSISPGRVISGYEAERKLPSSTAELHYMMAGTSANSSVAGNLYSNTVQTVFKQKSNLTPSGGNGSQQSRTDKTISKNYLNQLSSADSLQISNTSRSRGRVND